jgi:hypothetical protein
MIVQTALPDQPPFVIVQTDHARASAEFARQFGNDQFKAPELSKLMVYVTAHHDDGWAELDARWLQDPATGLPYHLVKTPLAELVRTGTGSPDVNEAYHPFCGIISSMHTYGLYHGRYGLSDKIFISLMPDDLKPFVTQMLADELARQARLKAQLAANPKTADWVDEAYLFHHYKLLQFFDTLALYFQTTHALARGTTTFENVPRAIGDDVTITLTPLGENRYGLSPYPFSAETVTLSTPGRYMTPQPIGSDLSAIASGTQVKLETVYLVNNT